jgi:aminopeptidase
VPAGFTDLLSAYAAVIVRIGLNLRRGQSLLIAEPFDLQGVSRAATALVDAVTTEARREGAAGVDVIWGDEERLRIAAREWPDRAFDRVLARNTARLLEAIGRGDALLFLQGGEPGLMDGIPARTVAGLRRRCWEHYGPVAQKLVHGCTNWSAACAPSTAWAGAAYPELEAGARLDALWRAVFAACRCVQPDPVEAWQTHLAALLRQRAALNDRHAARARLRGPGTDLVLALPPSHIWCTACLHTSDRRAFVANLPTEEMFTAPVRASAEGVLRAARPIAYGGALIDGVELTFHNGRVESARARVGIDLLQRLLATDRGSAHLGEVAIVPRQNVLTEDGRCFHHVLLDENALPHIALGDAYSFCVGERDLAAINHSLVHVDLPVEAEVELG